jgi:hypothetical protein
VLIANLNLTLFLDWASQQSWLQWQAMAASPWLRAFHVLWVILAAVGLYFLTLRLLGLRWLAFMKP